MNDRILLTQKDAARLVGVASTTMCAYVASGAYDDLMLLRPGKKPRFYLDRLEELRTRVAARKHKRSA